MPPMKKNTRPRDQVVSQWQPSMQVSWSLQQILSAIRCLAQGDFSRSAQLFRSMQEDDEIPDSLEKLVDSILCAPFSVECEDEKISQLTEELIGKILPEGQLTSTIESKVIQGAMVGTLDWTKTKDVWYPSLRFLEPEFLMYFPQTKEWKYNSQDGVLPVTPGDGSWVLWVDGEYGYLRAKIRALARLWYFKQATFRDWNRYNERHGLPIIKAFIPLQGEAGEKDDFVDDIQNMGSEGVVPLPVDTDEWSSYDLELLEPKDQSWGSFEAAIGRADRKIQIILSGGNLQTEIAESGASRAASETHADQLESTKAKSLSGKLCEFLREQVLTFFIAMNFGPDAEVPYICWQTEPPEDNAQNADALSKLATGLKTLGEAGYTVTNLDEVVEEFGLKLTYEKPEVLKPQPAPVLAPAGKGAPARKLALASGEEAPGAIEGVLFAEELADHVGKEAARLIKPSVKTLMSMVRSAESYPDLENRIRIAFSNADPSDLADLLEQSMILAQLDGRHAVLKDALAEEA